MEVMQCIKSVVAAANHYGRNKNDINLINLQRQLDVLISVTADSSNLRHLEHKDLLPMECLASLVNSLNDTTHSGEASTLAQKIMLLLTNFAQKNEIRHTLYHTLHITPLLATLLQQNDNEPTIVQCAELLQRVTYGEKVPMKERYTEDLLQFLVENILAAENDLTSPCLGSLANLCRNNYAVQTHIKHMDYRKKLFKKLFAYIKHKSKRISAFALSIFTALCKDEDFGQLLYDSKNINQTFQMMFNTLVKGDTMARKYLVDLFIDLLINSKVQEYLVGFPSVQPCMKQILSLLGSGEGEIVYKLFELLLSCCKVSGLRCIICKTIMNISSLKTEPVGREMLRQGQISEPFFAVVHWIGQSVESHDRAPLLALDFLKEIYEEIIGFGLISKLPPRTDIVLPKITETLMSPMGDVKTDSVMQKKCQKITKSLELLLVLCQDESLRREVSESVDEETLCRLIEYQFSHNAIAMNKTHGQLEDSQWSCKGVDVVLCTLELMLTLKKLDPNMASPLAKLLQDDRLVPFLAFGMTSDSRQRVQRSLRLVMSASQLEEFQTVTLGEAISSNNSSKHQSWQERKQLNTNSSGLSDSPYSAPIAPTKTSTFNKENVPTVKPGSRGTKRQAVDQDESVQLLIKKMQSGLDIKDARASEIISVYEHRLQSLQTKENHLQDLLDTKALALQQADRLIAQFRCRKAETEAELHKLHSLLLESEKSCEELRDQVNEMRLDREQLQIEMEQLIQDNQRLDAIADEHKDLTQVYNEQSQRLETTQKALAALKQEHTTMSEMHEMLRRHNETLKQQHDVACQQLSELEDERKSLSRNLKESDSKLQDLTKSHQKLEQTYSKTAKERDELEESIDICRENLEKNEKTKKDLQRQVSSLELVLRNHETAIREKDTLIQNQKTEIEKHNQIAQLINQLSSGKAENLNK
ncbi:unnamed protein product [Owenia fusiformis]|uniref:Uncharacterized protein n=1 Tax=Owenia fusiformis TaxID=6347 RepID=A0A8J1TCH8_OWEFU|nr:unnamed protein product [Owenia fusiformis]